MKSELLHLLAKLKSDHPDFNNLIISPNGTAMACLQHGCRRFENLDALEAYAWPQANLDHDSRSEQQNVGNKIVAGLGSPPYAWPQPENNESSVTLPPAAAKL